MKVNEKTLESINFAAKRYIGVDEIECIRESHLEARIDDHINAIVLSMRTKVFGESIENHVAERVPADWWEAVKERFALVRWIDRRPVRYREVTVDVFKLYPHLRTPAGHPRFVRVVVREPE